MPAFKIYLRISRLVNIRQAAPSWLGRERALQERL